LHDDNATATLRNIEAGNFGRCILPWLPLMHGGGDLGTIEEWRHVAGLEPDGRLRSIYAALALVFAELAGRRTEWKQALEGWNMRQSMVITEWQDEARAEGREEGREEGRRETQRAALLQVLEARFSVPVPNDLTTAIQADADAEELARWLKIASTADSLDAFRAAIQR
jgi:predicted transposase YdaD